MKTLKVLILGLFFGLLLKSFIDWIHRNRQAAIVTGEITLRKERMLPRGARRPSKSSEAEPAIQATREPKPSPTRTRKDNLKTIRGIGPAAEKKLNAAGISSFAALARLSVEDLYNVLGRSKRIIQSAHAILAEAKKLAK